VIHTGAIHLLHDVKFPFENIQSEKHYDPWTVYCNSKLANLLFTTALRRRIEQQETNKIVHVLAVHPGYSSTNLQANRFPLWELINDLLAMSSVEGALSQIFGAVDPSVVSLLSDPAQYIGPEWVLFGRPHVQWPLSSVAWSVDAQEHLWNESVRMTGVDFPASRP
jgi:NAD(P)-dependent dehydrogenase (short-subunit alcohol dehydrogenase family)